jgi:hypothetical protein
MAWYYEILGENEEVLETSEPIYASAVEAQMAARTLIKAEPILWGPMPKSGWKEQGGLRTIVSIGPKINVRSEASEGPS